MSVVGGPELYRARKATVQGWVHSAFRVGVGARSASDPLESDSDKESYGHPMQKVSWLMAPMGELMAAHLQTLKDYPPVRGGKSSDMSNVIQEFINNPRQ